MTILVIGTGRMGQALAHEINAAEDLTLLKCLERTEGPALPPADVYIDFSHPANISNVCSAAAERHIPLVLGTTGLTEEDQQQAERAARQTAVVQSANFSTGITILLRLLKEMQPIKPLFDVEIVEAHHRWKLDAPSGTAKLLAQGISQTPEQAAMLPIHAIRGGTAAGEHSVLFLGEHERIELHHHAESRSIFARGALLAARYALHQPPGLYTMENVLWDP